MDRLERSQLQLLGKHSQKARELRRRVRDRRPGEVVVDGWRIVHDLVRWGHPVSELYVAASRVASCDDGLLQACGGVFLLDDGVVAQMAPTRHPQGVLAIVPEPTRPAWTPGGTTVVLDGVQDPGNVGAAVRSSAALGAAAVLLSPGCADPWLPAAVRGSAGAVFQLPVFRSVMVDDAIAATRLAGGEVWATGASGTSIERWRAKEPLLILFGSEGAGLQDCWHEGADGTVAIALEREIDSLNLAVAVGIVLERVRAGITPPAGV